MRKLDGRENALLQVWHMYRSCDCGNDAADDGEI